MISAAFDTIKELLEKQNHSEALNQLCKIDITRLSNKDVEQYYKFACEMPERVGEKDILYLVKMMQLCSLLGYDEQIELWMSRLCRLRSFYKEGSEARAELEIYICCANVIRPIVDNAQMLLSFAILFNEHKNGHPIKVRFCATGNRPSVLSGSKDLSEWGKYYNAVGSILEPMLPAIMQGDCQSITNIAVAEQLYERNKLEECNVRLATAISSVDINASFAALTLQARLSRIEPGSTRWRKLMEHLKQLIEQNEAYWLNDNFKATAARFEILDGNREVISEWVTSIQLNELTTVNPQNAYIMDTLARAYIALGRLQEAATILEKLIDMNTRYHRYYDLIDCYIHSAIAFKNMSKNEMAFERLNLALTISMQYGFIRIFADKGKVLFHMIMDYRRENERLKSLSHGMSQYVSQIADAAKDFAMVCQNLYSSGDAAETSMPDLTQSETQILVMLDEGKTNQQIAQELKIKPATVKFHIGNLLKKFDVSNRTSLVSAFNKFSQKA